MLNEKNMSIEEILNYGIPYSDSIIIPNRVIEELFKERKKLIKQIQKMSDVIISNVGEYGSVLCTTFKIRHDGNKRVICYDSKAFLCSVVNSFGIDYDGDLSNKKEFISYIKNYIRNLRAQLKNVKDIEQLKSLNPILYKTIKEVKYSLIFNSEDVIKKCVDRFCNSLSRVSLNLESTCEALENPIPYSTFDGVDKEKLLFYLACCSLSYTGHKSEESFHNGIYTTMNYILEKGKDANVNLVLKNFCVVLGDKTLGCNDRYSYKNLLSDYREFRLNHSNIKEEYINPKRFEGKSFREINDYLELYRLTSGRILDANWELLPEGKREDNGVHCYTAKVKKNNKKINSKTEKVYKEKIEFFKDSEPLFRISGKDKFEGYTGFIYKNGLVFFEKIGTDDKMEEKSALYVMNIYNFIQFSQLTKQQIIDYNKNENNIKIKRIYHTDNWQERAFKVLDSKTNITMDEVNEVVQRQFVKKR